MIKFKNILSQILLEAPNGSNNKITAISVEKKRTPLTQPLTINENNGKQAALHKRKMSTA